MDRGITMPAIIKNDWVLIYEDSSLPVHTDHLVTSDGKGFVVTGGVPPHKPSSSGRVYGYWKADGEDASTCEYFPHVFNLKWVEG